MKSFTLLKHRSGPVHNDTREVTGTLEELTNYFSYTLECGASWNKKIKQHPKTIKSLISNLNKSFEEKEAACYNRTSVELKV